MKNAIVLLALFCSNISANLISNGSFETTTAVFGSDGGSQLLPGNTTVTGWTAVTREIAILKNGNVYGVSTTFGNNFLDLTGYLNVTPYGGVSQPVSGLISGENYTLTYDLMTLVGSGVFGGPVGATATIFGNSTNCIFSPPSSPTGNQTGLCTVNFTASGTSTTLTLVGLQGIEYIGLDNVDLEPGSSAGVPEPSTIVMTLVPLGLLFLTSKSRAAFRLLKLSR
jgi:hypothetical protein